MGLCSPEDMSLWQQSHVNDGPSLSPSLHTLKKVTKMGVFHIIKVCGKMDQIKKFCHSESGPRVCVCEGGGGGEGGQGRVLIS